MIEIYLINKNLINLLESVLANFLISCMRYVDIIFSFSSMFYVDIIDNVKVYEFQKRRGVNEQYLTFQMNVNKHKRNHSFYLKSNGPLFMEKSLKNYVLVIILVHIFLSNHGVSCGGK